MNNRLQTCTLALLIALAVGGCSEDYYGFLGECSGPVDTLAVYPELDFQQVIVISDTMATQDHDPGMAGMESLYLGSDGENSSDILVNFDFSNIFSEDYPESLFEESNIRSVKLTLNRLRPFLAENASSQPSWGGFYYLVMALEEPFDPETYRWWPGSEPTLEGTIFNTDFEKLNESDEPFILLWKNYFLDWVQSGNTVGMAIRAGAGSEGGLVGFASRELAHYNEVGFPIVGEVLAPALVIQFNEYIGSNNFLVIPPVNDSSTFDSVAAMPPDFAHVQTGLQSYPVLTYDLSRLLDNYCIHGMSFRLAADNLDPLHQDQDMTFTKMDPDSGWPSSGVILEEDIPYDSLFARLVYDRSNPGDPVAFTSNWDFSGDFYPAPEKVYLMPGYVGSHYFKSSIYFGQSTVFGPDAEPDNRPVLLLLTTKKAE